MPNDLISIVYTCTRTTSFSAWNFDAPWLYAGETAMIFGWWDGPGSANPFYKVRRNSDGDEKALHRSRLLDYGTIEGAT